MKTYLVRYVKHNKQGKRIGSYEKILANSKVEAVVKHAELHETRNYIHNGVEQAIKNNDKRLNILKQIIK